MNRPEKKNALSGDMLAGLVLGYEYIDETPEVRCAILTGAGGNFSSGADLVAMGQPSDDTKVQGVMARGDNPHWKALLRDYRLSKPLIAAVEGYAVAGGTEILAGHRHSRRRRGRDLRRVGGQARPVPARRIGVPAAAPDPVHPGDGHLVVVPRDPGDRSAADGT